MVETQSAVQTLGVVSKSHSANLGLVVPFSQVVATAMHEDRISTSYEEIDRVLGGMDGAQGIVPGAVMLVGGEPGIGKSTLMTQVCLAIAESETNKMSQTTQNSMKVNHKIGRESQKTFGKSKTTLNQVSKSDEADMSGQVTSSKTIVLYVCGEESPSQISMRIRRLIKDRPQAFSVESASSIQFVTTTDVDQIIALTLQLKPSLLVVDSIQTISTQDLTGGAGSFGQMRECTERLAQTVKLHHIPLFLIGHVTKEGTIAGPKIIEHIVDTVLELTGERTGELRLLRTIKNRFGATDEVGVFRMTQAGLEQVTNPNELFLEHEIPTSGSAVTCVLEGTRPFLVEVQALVVSSHISIPRRVGRGVELSRIQVLCAVLEKHCKVPLGVVDVFVNVAGGFTIREPAVDLSLALAMVTSYREKTLPKGVVCIGEVGLLGEIRPVSFLESRVKEAKRLGYQHIISHKTHSNLQSLLREFKLG